ncbi:MAG TPA: GNAT family N-acetyltransferase [Actinomycetota bacterium]|nr:GNAT family N-acetyltransferase [Actinomycetota bacterium]
MDDLEILIRAARDADSAGLIELIGGCYAEYPGCVLDVEREEPWLRAPATAYAGWEGRLWVAERDGRLVGSGGFRPRAPGVGGVHHLYVARPARRRGLATRLLGLIEAETRRRGWRRVDLWSDTRFTDAHRLYQRLGFSRSPGTRELGDLSRSVEYHFAKTLAVPSATT